MKSLIFLGLSLGLALADPQPMKIPQPALTCDHTVLDGSYVEGYTGCFPGQICTEDNKCVFDTTEVSQPQSFQRRNPLQVLARAPAYSTDGTCGKQNNGAICDPNSDAYPKGGCCSQYGYCGAGTAYCGTGCQSGCDGASPSSSAPVSKPSAAPRDDGRCGKDFAGATCDANGPYGGCCSTAGWCGKTDAHCLASNGCQNGCKGTVTSAPTSQPTGTTPRNDGRCGKDFGGATCDPKGAYGGCCSSAGWCGSTTNHCLASNGCQNGCSSSVTTKKPTSTSSGEPVISPTGGSSSNGGQTKDGTCGASNGNTICGNWPQGSCCSMYGYCGDTTGHCGTGCQSGPCKGTPVNGGAAPGASPAPKNSNGGSISVVGQSGAPAMHAGLLPNGRVTFLDKVENYTQVKLSNGQYAYSTEYDPATNKYVPLSYKTNAFCSGGSFLPDGRFISVGGNAPLSFIDPTVGDGFRGIRMLTRASSGANNGANWVESGQQLNTARWYASVASMPDGTQFVASGSLNGLDPTNKTNNNPTYEILSRTGVTNGKSVRMDILVKNQPYYMYPFIHVLNDGNLFFFVSKSSQIFNVAGNKIVKQLPDLPGEYRTYPNTGGSVMLPLSSSNGYLNDIVICGGGAFQDIDSPTEPSCGRIQPLSANPKWEMDSMPQGRGMVEATGLADGTVIWLNGCSKFYLKNQPISSTNNRKNRGAQGFGLAEDPTGTVLIYDGTKALGQRWSTGPTTNIARLYHSVALMLLDGTVMVAGSNPVEQPILKPVPNKTPSELYVTEFRVERYVPPYLSGANANKRPTNVVLASKSWNLGTNYGIKFNSLAAGKTMKVMMYQGGFVTHSVHMNARSIWLDCTGFKAGSTTQSVTCKSPPNHNVAPPQPYVIYVLVDGVPAIGQFISFA